MPRRHWAAAFIFLAAVLVLTNPLLLHIWNAVEDKQDALLNTWIIAWVGHAVIADPLNLYNTNIFYPYVNTLAFSDLLVPQGLLSLPLTYATGNPVFGYNVVLLAMLWLDAFAMYLLVLDWTGSRVSGWLAGIVFGLSPFNLGNLAQIQLLSLGFMPLALLSLRRMLRSRGGWSLALCLFVLFFVLESLSSLYYALLTGSAVLVLAAWHLVIERPVAKRELRPMVLRLAIAAALIGVILAPFLVPYARVQRDLGLERKLQESEPFSASLSQYAQVSPQNLAYGRLLSPQPVHYEGGYPLDDLFPGLLPAALALWAAVASRDRFRWFWIGLAATAFVLSLGPRLYLAPGMGTGLALPYRWLYEWFPPMRALRAPIRFDALMMLALAALAGLGLRDIISRFRVPARGEAVPLFGFAVIVLAAVEYLAVPAANITVVPVGAEVPPVYRWLSEQPRGVTIELPLMGPDQNNRLDLSTQYLSTYHWNPTLDGYSGFVPPGRGAMGYELSAFPSPRAISVLQALGTKRVVVHFDRYSKTSGVSPGAVAKTPGLIEVSDFGDVRVYEVAAPLGRADALQYDWYIPQPIASGGPFTAYIIVSNKSPIPLATVPTEKINWTVQWNDGLVERVTTGAPLVTSSVSVIPLRLTAPTKAGEAMLKVNASGAIGNFTLAGNLNVGNEAAAEIVIPARVRLSDPVPSTLSPGSPVTARLEWNPLNKIDGYYSASLRVVDEKENKVTNVDREPAGQTLLWRPEEPVADQFTLNLPADLPPGRYRVELLMYDGNSDAAVLLLDTNNKPQEKVVLGEFDVK